LPSGFFLLASLSQKYQASAGCNPLPFMALIGNLTELPFVDLVQTCCLSHSTTHISLNFGKNKGSVFLLNGEIIDAAIEDLRGEEAFYKILQEDGGSFLTQSNPSFVPARTINRSWQHLLLDGMRLLDETKNGLIAPDLSDETSNQDEKMVLNSFDSNKNSLIDPAKSDERTMFELAAQNSSDEHGSLLQNLLSSGVVERGIVVDNNGSTICEINESHSDLDKFAFLVKEIKEIVMPSFHLGELNGAVLEVRQKSLLVKQFQNLSLVFARPNDVPIVRAFDAVDRAFEGALGISK
jgi:hypothetical protein